MTTLQQTATKTKVRDNQTGLEVLACVVAAGALAGYAWKRTPKAALLGAVIMPVVLGTVAVTTFVNY